jgi:very-short-patch-repair endonuclease
MTKPKWPVNKDMHAYMKAEQESSLVTCRTNANENWMRDILKTSKYNWTRQAQWGYRLFDFWCSTIGVAIELEDPEQDIPISTGDDAYNYTRSGIKVIRVRSRNKTDADNALAEIAKSET